MKLIKKIIKFGLMGGIIVVGAFLLLVIGVMVMDSKPSKPSESQSVSTTYIDVEFMNEKALINETYQYQLISFSYQDYINMNTYLNQNKPTFSYGSYYRTKEAIDYMNQMTYHKEQCLDLLNHEGKIDVDLLLAKVQSNNEAFLENGSTVVSAFYKTMDMGQMRKICEIICEVVNAQPVDVSLFKMADTLLDLKIFERTGSASNAYVSDDLTFVFNPTMTSLYAGMQQITGQANNQSETERAVIVHEIMHLFQYGASDRNEKNGLEAGVCRMYNTPGNKDELLVDSLWLPWILEASAELEMADYLGVETGTYEKKISYARSYNLSRFNQTNSSLQEAVFASSLEKAMDLLGEKSMINFVDLLYSVEITQSDPEDFWSSYNQELTENEKLNIRMVIRQEVVLEMMYHYYLNLSNALYERKINDLSTLFYMMRVWELDAYNHLEYTKEEAFEVAKPFINEQHHLQEQLFKQLDSPLDGLWQQYNDYCLYTKEGVHASLDLLNVPIELNDLRSSNFCRNEAMYQFMNQH